MDRPRSPVKNAGLWLRSIQPLRCSSAAKHEERGSLPAVGRDDPARWRLFDCHWRPIKPPRLPPRRAWGGGLGLLPVHRLLQPARGHRELRMLVVVADHLLDVVVVVAVAAEVVPVAAPFVHCGHGDGDWHNNLCL